MPDALMTNMTFREHMLKMKAGQSVVYHVGSIMRDRQLGPSFQTIHALASAVWSAAEMGLVTLTQRKVGRFDCEYIATKNASPFMPVEWTGCYRPEGR